MIQKRTCKSALVRSRISVLDYAVNPYLGCAHGCVYCYATFMARYSGHSEPWGSFVDVKANLPEVLAQEVRRRKPGRVGIGTVCDPYQPAEANYGLTRSALGILGKAGFSVSVATKSDLVTRDIDVLQDVQDATVEITVTTLDENAARFFEPGAPSMDKRFEAMERLVKAGVRTGAFFGPVLPFFSDRADKVEQLFEKLSRTGVRRVLVDRFNYLRSKYPLIQGWLRANRPEAVPHFEKALRQPGWYRQRLGETILGARKYGLDCRVLF